MRNRSRYRNRAGAARLWFWAALATFRDVEVRQSGVRLPAVLSSTAVGRLWSVDVPSLGCRCVACVAGPACGGSSRCALVWIGVCLRVVCLSERE